MERYKPLIMLYLVDHGGWKMAVQLSDFVTSAVNQYCNWKYRKVVVLHNCQAEPIERRVSIILLISCLVVITHFGQ